jgi:hypothetical protein
MGVRLRRRWGIGVVKWGNGRGRRRMMMMVVW